MARKGWRHWQAKRLERDGKLLPYAVAAAEAYKGMASDLERDLTQARDLERARVANSWVEGHKVGATYRDTELRAVQTELTSLRKMLRTA